MYFSAADHTVCLNSIFARVWTSAFKISDLTAWSLVTALGGKDLTQLVSLHLVSLGTKEMTKSLNLFRYFATDTD